MRSIRAARRKGFVLLGARQRHAGAGSDLYVPLRRGLRLASRDARSIRDPLRARPPAEVEKGIFRNGGQEHVHRGMQAAIPRRESHPAGMPQGS